VGSPTFTVSKSGYTSAAQSATITAAPASVVAITSTALSGVAAATATLGPARVTLRDAFGNTAVAPTGGTTVALASNSPATGGIRFSLTSGGVSITTLSIAAGSSTGTFYYGDQKSGSPTITASATGFTSGTQVEAISPAAAVNLVFTTPPVASVHDAVMPVVRVTVTDAFGNTPTAAVPVTVAINVNAGLGVLQGTLTATTVAGVATFSDLSINGVLNLGLGIEVGGPGNGYKLQGSSPGITTIISPAFNVS
jgi:hypothetical protein